MVVQLLNLPAELLDRVLSFCYETWYLVATDGDVVSALDGDSTINTHMPTCELDLVCRYLQPMTSRARTNSFSSVLYDDLDRSADLATARFEGLLSRVGTRVRHVRVVRPHSSWDYGVYRTMFPNLESLDSLCPSGRFPNMRSVLELMPLPGDVAAVLGGQREKIEKIERVLSDPGQHGWRFWLRARGWFADKTVANYWTIKFHFLTCDLDLDGYRHPLPSAGYVGDMVSAVMRHRPCA